MNFVCKHVRFQHEDYFSCYSCMYTCTLCKYSCTKYTHVSCSVVDIIAKGEQQRQNHLCHQSSTSCHILIRHFWFVNYNHSINSWLWINLGLHSIIGPMFHQIQLWAMKKLRPTFSNYTPPCKILSNLTLFYE